MKMPSVLEQFEDYRSAVVPAEAGPVQVEETKHAFYAGAFSMLMFVLQAVGDESTSEEEGIAQLEALKQECLTFSEQVQANPKLPRPPEPSSYTLRNPDIESRLRDIGKYIEQGLPKEWGFNLLLFTFGGPGAMFYISNGERVDVIEAMKEFIRKNTN